jgi:hypothetical protein
MQAGWCYVVCMRFYVLDLPSFNAAHHTPLSFPLCGRMSGILNRAVRDVHDMLKWSEFFLSSFTFSPIEEHGFRNTFFWKKISGEFSFYKNSTVRLCASHINGNTHIYHYVIYYELSASLFSPISSEHNETRQIHRTCFALGTHFGIIIASTA